VSPNQYQNSGHTLIVWPTFSRGAYASLINPEGIACL
jgi:hypothetical protein